MGRRRNGPAIGLKTKDNERQRCHGWAVDSKEIALNHQDLPAHLIGEIVRSFYKTIEVKIPWKRTTPVLLRHEPCEILRNQSRRSRETDWQRKSAQRTHQNGEASPESTGERTSNQKTV
jgi:hypothetical protein